MYIHLDDTVRWSRAKLTHSLLVDLVKHWTLKNTSTIKIRTVSWISHGQSFNSLVTGMCVKKSGTLKTKIKPGLWAMPWHRPCLKFLVRILPMSAVQARDYVFLVCINSLLLAYL